MGHLDTGIAAKNFLVSYNRKKGLLGAIMYFHQENIRSILNKTLGTIKYTENPRSLKCH